LFLKQREDYGRAMVEEYPAAMPSTAALQYRLTDTNNI
jgi:hypothetical protein